MQNSVMVCLGGKERELKFTRSALMKLERVLPNQNLYLTIATGVIPYAAEAFALMFALEGGGGKKRKTEEIEKWMEEYTDENGAMSLNQKLIEALFLSGFMGNPTKFKELMGNDEEETEEVDTKNE